MISILTIPDQGSCPFQSLEIDHSPDKKFRQGFIGVFAAAGGARRNNRLPCPLAPQGGNNPVRYMRECESGGVAEVFCPLLRWCWTQGMCGALFLLQVLQKRQLGFSVSLYILGPECAPTAHARSYEFSAFCCSRRGVSRCMHHSTAVKGPRSQAPLNRRSPSGPCISRLLPQWKGERSIMRADQEDLLWDRVCSPVSPRKETVCPRGRWRGFWVKRKIQDSVKNQNLRIQRMRSQEVRIYKLKETLGGVFF